MTMIKMQPSLEQKFIGTITKIRSYLYSLILKNFCFRLYYFFCFILARFKILISSSRILDFLSMYFKIDFDWFI